MSFLHKTIYSYIQNVIGIFTFVLFILALLFLWNCLSYRIVISIKEKCLVKEKWREYEKNENVENDLYLL